MEHDDETATETMETAAWSAASADPAFWLSAAIALALALYVWGMWHFDRFTAQRMPFLPARPFVGSAAPFLLGRRDFHRYVQGLYAKARGPLVGLFHGQNAALLLRDPRLVRRALVEAAAAFPLRAPPSPSEHDHSTTSPIGRRVVDAPPHPMLDKHLMGLPWRRWRGVRRELDASFTAALKATPCLEAVEDAARRLAHVIELKAAKQPANRGVDIRNPLEGYWSDSLGSMIFGRSATGDEDFHNKRTALCISSEARCRWFHSLCPRIAQTLRVPVIPRKVERYFYNLGDDMAQNVKKLWLQGCNEETIISEDLNEKLRKSSALWNMLESYLTDNTTGKKSGALEWRSKSNIFSTLQVIQPTRKRSLKMPKVEITLAPITEEVKDTVHSASTHSSSTSSHKSTPEEKVDPKVSEVKERLEVTTKEMQVQNNSHTGFTINEGNVNARSPARDVVDSLKLTRNTVDTGNSITLSDDTITIKGTDSAENKVILCDSEQEKLKMNINSTECNKEVMDNPTSDVSLQGKNINTTERKLDEKLEVSTETRETAMRAITKTDSQTDIAIHIHKHESTQTTVNTSCALSCVRATENVTYSSGNIVEVSKHENQTIQAPQSVNKVESDNISRTRAATMVAEAQVTQAMDSLASKFGSTAISMNARDVEAASVSPCSPKTGERASPVSGEIIISKEKTKLKIFGSTKKHEILKTEVKNSKLVGHIIVAGKILGSRNTPFLVRSSSDNIINVERRKVTQATRDQIGKDRDDTQILFGAYKNMNPKNMETIKTVDIFQSTGSEVGEEMKTTDLKVRNAKERKGQRTRTETEIIQPRNHERVGEKHDINETKVQEVSKISALQNSEKIKVTEMKELRESDQKEDSRAKRPELENTNILQKLTQEKNCERVLKSAIDHVVESTEETDLLNKEMDDRKSKKDGTEGNKLGQDTNVRRKIGVIGEPPKSNRTQNVKHLTVVETKEPKNIEMVSVRQVPLIQVESEQSKLGDSTQTVSKSLNIETSSVSNMSEVKNTMKPTNVKVTPKKQVPLIKVESEQPNSGDSTETSLKQQNTVSSNSANTSVGKDKTEQSNLGTTLIRVPQIKVEPEQPKVGDSTDKPSDPIDPKRAEESFHESARSSTASLAAQVAEGARRGALIVALALRLLAEHPQAQQQAAEEAMEAEKKGTPHTPYIDAVIAETLRLWPPEAVVTRARLGAGPWRGDGAAAAALGGGGTLAGTSSASNVTLQPDDVLWVPITALHRDSKYWTRPFEFIPERFLSTRETGSSLECVGEGCGATERGVYLPFGLGPRACAGREVVLHVAKAALLCLLAKLEFSQPTTPSERRRRQPRAAMWRYFLDIEGGFSLVVKRRCEK